MARYLKGFSKNLCKPSALTVIRDGPDTLSIIDWRIN